MRLLLLLVFVFVSGFALGIETGVVVDPDGYSNLRSSPSSSSRIVEKLISGEIVKIEAREGKWARVKTELGKTGFLHESRISLMYQGPNAEGNNEFAEDGEAASWSGINYPLARKYARAGRESAIRLFFWMARHGEFDGAAATGLADDCFSILESVGDAAFAKLLSAEPKETRQAVVDDLLKSVDDLGKFPATARLGS